MKTWKWGEWSAYGALFVASIIIAADAAFRNAPEVVKKMPAFLDSSLWGFAPLALVLFATVVLVANHLGWIGKEKGQPVVEKASISLQIYGDSRHPHRINEENIWRWYWLRTNIIGPGSDGNPITHNVNDTVFLAFDKPLSAGTLAVSSPDIKLPTHEVKEFNARFAIITFISHVEAGTIHFTAY